MIGAATADYAWVDKNCFHWSMKFLFDIIKVKDDSQLDESLTHISEFDNVYSAIAVVGRYDIFAEVVFAGEMEDLYCFMSQKTTGPGEYWIK